MLDEPASSINCIPSVALMAERYNWNNFNIMPLVNRIPACIKGVLFIF